MNTLRPNQNGNWLKENLLYFRHRVRRLIGSLSATHEPQILGSAEVSDRLDAAQSQLDQSQTHAGQLVRILSGVTGESNQRLSANKTTASRRPKWALDESALADSTCPLVSGNRVVNMHLERRITVSTEPDDDVKDDVVSLTIDSRDPNNDLTTSRFSILLGLGENGEQTCYANETLIDDKGRPSANHRLELSSKRLDNIVAFVANLTGTAELPSD